MFSVSSQVRNSLNLSYIRLTSTQFKVLFFLVNYQFMGRKISQLISQYSYNQTADATFHQDSHIGPEEYQIINDQVQSLNHLNQSTPQSHNDNNIKRHQRDSIHRIKAEKLKKKTKIKSKNTIQGEINARDIIDIIIVILLVIILGVQLFRVVLEVQVQYKNQEKSNATPNYINIHKQNSPNQNLEQPISNKVNEISAGLTIKTQCKNYIDSLLKQKGSLYDFNVPYEVFRIKSRASSYKQSRNTQISKEQFSEAVDLLGLIHQVDENGKLTVKQDPCEALQTKQKRIEKTLSSQAIRLNTKYQMDSYYDKQIPFCLVVNSYNNAHNGLIYRNVDSILQQNYTNYHVVYTDDNSTDETGLKVKEYLQSKNISQEKFEVFINERKLGMMENIYNAIHYHCREGQVAVMIDGDDSLIGTNVLSLLNAVYHKDKPALLWANFVSIYINSQVNIGFSKDYAEKQKKQSSFRKNKYFISSHLKTFFVDLFKKIKPQDLQTNDGKFYGGASDTAMMFPMLEMANPRIKYLGQILYQYRYDTGQSGNYVNKIPQKEALKKIYDSPPYERLTDFSFVQKTIETTLQIPQQEKNQQAQQITTEISQIDQMGAKNH